MSRRENVLISSEERIGSCWVEAVEYSILINRAEYSGDQKRLLLLVSYNREDKGCQRGCGTDHTEPSPYVVVGVNASSLSFGIVWLHIYDVSLTEEVAGRLKYIVAT